MKTQKQVLEAFKSTVAKLAVYSFSPDGNRRRTEAYLGVDCITALSEMSARLAEGKLVILTDADGERILQKMEFGKIDRGEGRLTYEEAFPYSIALFDDLCGNPLGNIKK